MIPGCQYKNSVPKLRPFFQITNNYQNYHYIYIYIILSVIFWSTAVSVIIEPLATETQIESELLPIEAAETQGESELLPF